MNAGLARAATWVWRSDEALAVAARVALLPAAGLFRLGTMGRNAAWDLGFRAARTLPVPSVGIGNLSVGGTGKTPVAIFIVRRLASMGLKPAVLLRGYGADETAEHAAALPDLVVETGADRHASAARAVARGAQVLVLDDCLQRRDVRTDVMLAVVAEESWDGAHLPLPAGPWREGEAALGRADAVVVTRKAASQDEAQRLALRLAGRTRGGKGIVAALEPSALVPLGGGAARTTDTLKGRDVVAVAGIGEPDLFAVPFERLGARVRLVPFPDHHAYTAADVAAILRMMPVNGVIVTTAKDAVKLQPLWPAHGPECLVARLAVTITAGAPELDLLLERVRPS